MANPLLEETAPQIHPKARPLEEMRSEEKNPDLLLAIDVGNTNIVLGFFSGDQLLFTDRLPTRRAWAEGDLAQALDQIFQSHNRNPKKVEGAVMSSVVPKLNPLLKEAVKSLSGREILQIHPGIPCGIDASSYDTTSLGMDRITDLTAAMTLYGKPVAVFDLGTATTLTLVDDNGALAGGMISPGIGLSLEALAEHTASLPLLEAEPVDYLLGRDTRSNMLAGAVAGCGIRIDATVERLREEPGLSGLTTVITGGLGKLVLPWIRTPVIYDPDLLLKGLSILFHRIEQDDLEKKGKLSC